MVELNLNKLTKAELITFIQQQRESLKDSITKSLVISNLDARVRDLNLEIERMQQSVSVYEERIHELESEVAILDKANKDWAEIARTFTCSLCNMKEREEVPVEETPAEEVPAEAIIACEGDCLWCCVTNCERFICKDEPVEELDPRYVTWSKLEEMFRRTGYDAMGAYIKNYRKD